MRASLGPNREPSALDHEVHRVSDHRIKLRMTVAVDRRTMSAQLDVPIDVTVDSGDLFRHKRERPQHPSRDGPCARRKATIAVLRSNETRQIEHLTLRGVGQVALAVTRGS